MWPSCFSSMTTVSCYHAPFCLETMYRLVIRLLMQVTIKCLEQFVMVLCGTYNSLNCMDQPSVLHKLSVV
jgi:hypothetical protein